MLEIDMALLVDVGVPRNWWIPFNHLASPDNQYGSWQYSHVEIPINGATPLDGMSWGYLLGKPHVGWINLFDPGITPFLRWWQQLGRCWKVKSSDFPYMFGGKIRCNPCRIQVFLGPFCPLLLLKSQMVASFGCWNLHHFHVASELPSFLQLKSLKSQCVP